MVRENQVYPFSRLHHFLLSELTSEPQIVVFTFPVDYNSSVVNSLISFLPLIEIH